MHNAICVYCPNSFDSSKGEGDHVLPLAFGDFDGAIIFRGACPRCNNKLSPLEEELLRTAPEAVLRRLAGATKNRRGEPTGWVGASGLPPPKFLIRHSDHTELVDADPNNPGRSVAVDQLVIALKNGQEFHLRLFPSMSVDAVRRKFGQFGIDVIEIDRIFWHWDEKNSEQYRLLLKQLWPNGKNTEGPVTSAGVHDVPVRIESRFTQKYYRAIAKIAFHYYLCNSRYHFTGREACFGPIREFITEGRDGDRFFQSQKPQFKLPVGILPDGTALLPARWMHLLCGIESASSAVVAVYTLFGPDRPPSPHFVTLFQQPSLLYLPGHHYGHAYIYGKPELGDTRAAFVEPLSIQMVG